MSRHWQRRTTRIELMIIGIVTIGVLALGVFDFAQGQPPAGLFGLGRTAGLAAFIISCLACAAVSALATVTDGQQQQQLRRGQLVIAFAPAMLADPTYAVLFLLLPLIGVRRHGSGRSRIGFTILIAAGAATLLLTESSPRVSAELEAMVTVGIVFLIVTLLGDSLRQLDQGLSTETALAKSMERERLSAEIHDSLGHHMLATSIQLKKAKAYRGRGEAAEVEVASAIDLAGEAVAEALAETRLLVEANRNLRGFQIESRVRDLADRITSPVTIVTVEFNGDHDRIEDTAQLTLYRVVQEALSNVVRHSGASKARIVSTVDDDRVRLQVLNNGLPFDSESASPSRGIANMRHRVDEAGGTLAITSDADETAISVEVPL